MPTAPTRVAQALALAEDFAEQGVGVLVRGAGVERRSRRAARGPRARSGRHGGRGRRVRLRPAVLRAHARRRGGRRAAGRRDPVRGHHRAAARRRALPRARAAAVVALRARGACRTSRRRSRSLCTWSTSTITSGSSGCSSTACSSRATAHCGRISPRRAWGSSSSARGAGGRRMTSTVSVGGREPARRPRPADPVRGDRRLGAAVERRGVRQPLQRLVREQVDVGARSACSPRSASPGSPGSARSAPRTRSCRRPLR